MGPLFHCSVKVDEQDVMQGLTRSEYVCRCQVHIVSSTFFLFSRRIKIKTEKAIYTEEVGADTSSDLKSALFP